MRIVISNNKGTIVDRELTTKEMVAIAHVLGNGPEWHESNES